MIMKIKLMNFNLKKEIKVIKKENIRSKREC